MLALVMLTGCASSDATARRSYLGEEEIARPERVIVYNFAATADDIPLDAAIAGRYARRGAPQTGREIQLGRQLGAQVAVALVEEISKMGFAATRAADGPPPQPGDLVIKVEFFSIDEGSRTKRMLIRFGAGASELKTFVEGYQDTATGLRPLGSVEIEAGGGKMPGMIVPVAGGAVAGSAAASAAVRGTLNISQEMSPESIRGTAKRKAEEIAKVFSEAFKKRGWI